ncbi:GTPase [Roseimaritima sediminicola]|uniref:GTPase n=1 Tax=Roseimaritima sediminicola TaxID=2662066 RepID=UPI0012983E73|nr:GTPase [Roseimaritima sediminicola]
MPQPVSSAATVACELTGVGRGGVATVGLWTPVGDASSLYQDHVRPFFRPANPAAHPEPGRIVYGTWYGDGVPPETPAAGDAAAGDAAGGDAAATSAGESVVVTAADQRTVHVHCHGGRAAVEAILQAVESSGAVRCPWPEWLASTGMPLLEVEAREVLAAATTRATAAIAYDQVRGALRDAARRWQQGLHEDAEQLDAVRQEVRSVLGWKRVGQHLQTPWQVVLAGEPNVGKSSLMNALVGYDRAITFDSPGTTRDILSADTVLDGWPVQLSDTAGLRRAADSIEDEGVRRARQRIEDADLTLWIQDARHEEGPQTAAAEAESQHLIVRNKVDLLPADHDERRRACEPERSGGDDAVICISATAGWNLDGLIAAIVRRLVPQTPPPGQPMPVNARQEACLEAAAAADTAKEITTALERLIDGSLSRVN